MTGSESQFGASLGRFRGFVDVILLQVASVVLGDAIHDFSECLPQLGAMILGRATRPGKRILLDFHEWIGRIWRSIDDNGSSWQRQIQQENVSTVYSDDGTKRFFLAKDTGASISFLVD